MVHFIGVILLIYGIVGVAVVVLAIWFLRTPLQQIRPLLTQAANSMHQASGMVGDGLTKARNMLPFLRTVSSWLGQANPPIRSAANHVGEAAGFNRNVEAGLDSVAVPALVPTTKSLNLSFSATVPSLSFSECGLDLRSIGLGNHTFLCPPVSVTNNSIGFNLGTVNVITGLGMTTAHPLQPVGDIFGNVATKLEQVEAQINQVGDAVAQSKTALDDTTQMVDQTVTALRDVPAQLEDTSQKVRSLSTNPALTLLPLVALAYFGLIHAAFALAGIALIIV